MPVRHALLAVAAVLVTGMCVYLFLEVRAAPAAVQPKVVASSDTPASDEQDDGSHTDEKPAGKRSGVVRSLTKQPDATPSSTSTSSTPAIDPGDDKDKKLTGPKLDAVLAEANKAYDKQDFDEARAIAQRVLKQYPDNVRMLRIMTSSHCIEADTAESQKYFNLLPAPDREQMKTRCARYGVTFSEPPAK